MCQSLLYGTILGGHHKKRVAIKSGVHVFSFEKNGIQVESATDSTDSVCRRGTVGLSEQASTVVTSQMWLQTSKS